MIAEKLRVIIGTPEMNVAMFALLLNFSWEILQASLYAGMVEAPRFQMAKGCLQATVGDMAIMLFAYEFVAIGVRSRRWILAASRWQPVLFVAVGVSITAAIEWLATRGRWVARWNYLPEMPLLPGTGIGLSPLVQWVVLPLLTIWFARRQLTRQRKDARSHVES